MEGERKAGLVDRLKAEVDRREEQYKETSIIAGLATLGAIGAAYSDDKLLDQALELETTHIQPLMKRMSNLIVAYRKYTEALVSTDALE